jgi:hypothetical protein
LSINIPQAWHRSSEKRYHRMTDPYEIAREALYALSACQPSDLHLQAQR